MNLELINAIACGLIAFWATLCVLSGKVRDGVKVWLCRTLHCVHCLHCDKAPGGVERRVK
ncbi:MULTISPECIES: hypothetical protein [Pseudomonas fluorescens group]|uniref:Uncharacterized protein n=1 Tax=Pseudomonas fluorescens TaxID=294 RepID=A0ACD4Y1N4_PSEFL|nr:MULTISPECIES: hypothetical protein [Pseudomonas fluorescens group]WQD75355.1 hypothetical protein U0037_14760 [Pseudomonas marginalis]